MEPELNGRLPYLDVELLKQNDGRIPTKWYNKEMASNRMLNVNNLTDKIIRCVKKYDPNIKIYSKNFKTIKKLIVLIVFDVRTVRRNTGEWHNRELEED